MLVLALALCPVLAAESTDDESGLNFVAPRVGVAGGVGGRGFNVAVARADLALGGEWHLRTGYALGFDVQLGFVTAVHPDAAHAWSHLVIGPKLVWASRFDDSKPFVNVSAGPAFTATWDGNEIDAALGATGQLEVAAGFKSIAELFASATVGGDARGLNASLVAGARLNLVLIVKFFALLQSIVDPDRHTAPADASYK